MITADLNTVSFDRWAKSVIDSLPDMVEEFVSEVGNDTKNELIKETPKDTGALASKWTLEKTKDSFRAYLNGSEHDLNVLKWLEFGTGLFGPLRRMIKPNVAKYMHWVDKLTGKHIFARETKGIRPFAMIGRTRVILEHTWRDRFLEHMKKWKG